MSTENNNNDSKGEISKNPNENIEIINDAIQEVAEEIIKTDSLDERPSNVAVINNNFSFTNWGDIIQSLVGSKSSGIKTVGEGALVLLKAKELNIGFANALPHIHLINGKTGIDIHIVKALLTKPSAGVRFECTRNYQPIYRYLHKRGVELIQHDSTNVPSNYFVIDKFKDNEAVVSRVIADGNYPVVFLDKDDKGNGLIYDYLTEYTFTRKKQDIDGTWYTDVKYGRFSLNDAKQAGLYPSNAYSPWTKYTSLMIATRAFTYGSREIASDLLMGVYDYSELLDLEGRNYDVNPETGSVTTILDKTGNPIQTDK